jgi:hypothetical protein
VGGMAMFLSDQYLTADEVCETFNSQIHGLGHEAILMDI